MTGDTRRVVAAAVLGGLAGAGVALLVAPRAGRDLRRELIAALDRARNLVESSELERHVTRIVGGALDRAEGVVHGGHAAIDDALQGVRTAIEAGRTAYHQELRRIEAEGPPG
jgi:gas vesicle protein